MEAPISIPDPIFKQARLLARRLDKTLSELYTEAVAEYLSRHGTSVAAKTENRPRPPQAKRRTQEHAWRRSHQDALLEFAGQWVVLEGEEIVVHGTDPARLVEDARAKGVEVPYIFYVEQPRPRTVRIGL